MLKRSRSLSGESAKNLYFFPIPVLFEGVFLSRSPGERGAFAGKAGKKKGVEGAT
jgi:hypothetical protein